MLMKHHVPEEQKHALLQGGRHHGPPRCALKRQLPGDRTHELGCAACVVPKPVVGTALSCAQAETCGPRARGGTSRTGGSARICPLGPASGRLRPAAGVPARPPLCGAPS